VAQPTAAQVVRSNRVLLIAHRGNSREAPENTLSSFESAAAVGVDFIELDYHHSADDVPIVAHDAMLDRATNARELWGGEKIKLASKTAAELSQLDAGSWFSPKFAGTRLPTLEQALATILPHAMTFIERKAGSARVCVDLLRKLDCAERVVVQAFDWEFVADCHQLAPELIVGALGDKELTAEHLDRAIALGATLVGWNAKFLSAKTLAAAHERGLKVWSYTIDDPVQASELIAAGLDGVISNVPARIKPLIPKRA
jgi:glycerophosphoryl diester phosphodiesterase